MSPPAHLLASNERQRNAAIDHSPARDEARMRKTVQRIADFNQRTNNHNNSSGNEAKKTK